MIVRRTHSYMVLVIVTLWLATSGALPSRREIEENDDNDECEGNNDEPLCGSNSVTYLNLCEFQKDLFKNPKLTIVRNEVCDCEPADQYDWNPVCGTDNQSYANICEYVQEKERHPSLSVHELGLCEAMLKRKTVTWRELQKLEKWQSFMPNNLYEELSSRDVAEVVKNAPIKSKNKRKKSEGKKKN